jgi:hypothetical protein
MMISGAGRPAGNLASDGLVAVSHRGADHGKIHVSDRALVRFLERAGAFDVEMIRGMIANSLERGRVAAERAGVTDFQIVVDGLCYAVERGCLVNVTGDDRHRRRWAR